MASSKNSIVQLQAYTVSWQWRYRWEWLKLRLALIGRIQGVEHFGSTALPGMLARPIIDIGVIVPDHDRAYECVRLIEQLGYNYRGENSEQRSYYFTKGQPIRFHLYVYECLSPKWQDRLAFRNYLRAHTESARAYAELKRTLAHQFPADLCAYQAGKLTFVQQVLRAVPLEHSRNE